LPTRGAALNLLVVGEDQLGLDRLDVGERSTRPSGCGTPSSSWQRTTWQIASVSRIEARNWLPSPSPSEAPLTRPAMSWKSIVAGSSSLLRTVFATASSRSSGTCATATFGSIVVNG
jgi:hypothetical protein